MFVDPGTFSAGRRDADALRRITPSRRALVGATAAGLVTAGVAVPSRDVLELGDASSGCMRLSNHAARSMI